MKPPDEIPRRQLQHWIKLDMVFPPGEGMPGQGKAREWTPEAIQKVRIIWRLRQLGFELKPAVAIADQILLDWTVVLKYGVTMCISPTEFFRDD